MIPEKEFKEILLNLEILAIQIRDRFGNFVYQIDGKDGKDVCSQFDALGWKKSYGSLEIRGANAAILRSSWRGAYNWKVNTSGETTGTQVQQQQQPTMASNMKEMLEVMLLMKQMNGVGANDPNTHERILKAELDKFKAENSIELKKLEMQQNNPMNQYGAFLPIGMSLMGKTPEEIRAVMGMTAMANIQGPPNVLTKGKFSKVTDFANWTNDQKNARIAELETQLFSKIAAEHFIILLEILIDDPKRAEKAIVAAENGMI